MKNFDWRSLLRMESGSILMILCGILLAAMPDFASVLVSALFGWALIAGGVILLIFGFAGGWRIGPIVMGALLLLTGAWLHRNPLMIVSVVGMVLGILTLSQGLRSAVEVYRAGRTGGFRIPGTVLAVVQILVGIRLLLSPLSLSRLVLSICGIVMVVCGICNLVAHYRAVRYISGSDSIIDADQ